MSNDTTPWMRRASCMGWSLRSVYVSQWCQLYDVRLFQCLYRLKCHVRVGCNVSVSFAWRGPVLVVLNNYRIITSSSHRDLQKLLWRLANSEMNPGIKNIFSCSAHRVQNFTKLRVQLQIVEYCFPLLEYCSPAWSPIWVYCCRPI